MKTTEEKNRMIAEFMGASGFDILGEKVEPRYHTSWDWLMPVVERIESDNSIEFKIAQSRVNISHNTDHSIETFIIVDILGTKIKAVYQAVVEFIEWYNEQK